jgi:hypothetical protein
MGNFSVHKHLLPVLLSKRKVQIQQCNPSKPDWANCSFGTRQNLLEERTKGPPCHTKVDPTAGKLK